MGRDGMGSVRRVEKDEGTGMRARNHVRGREERAEGKNEAGRLMPIVSQQAASGAAKKGACCTVCNDKRIGSLASTYLGSVATPGQVGPHGICSAHRLDIACCGCFA